MASSSLHALLLQNAAAALQRGARDEAVALCRQAIGQFGEDANALMVLGVVSQESGDVAGAIAHLERARALMPNHIHVLVNLGSAYRAAGRLHEARMTLEAALQLDRRFAVAHNNLGNVMLDLGDRDGAKRAYERAAAGQANYAEPVAGLARIAEEEHRLDDARQLAERALRLSPQNVLAQLTRARVLSRDGDPAAALPLLESLLRSVGLTATNRVIAEGFLGEVLDQLGRVDDAFAAFARANELQYSQFAPIYHADRGSMSAGAIERLTTFVRETDLARWSATPPAGGTAPVFLVGFPRSGTTLLDQILASHPEITTLEERDTLAGPAAVLFQPDQGFGHWADLPGGEVERLRALYWGQVKTGLAGAPMKSVFVDKLPLNAVYLPLIYRLFPAAKIILAIRDPRDVVLSCYQQRFGMNPAMFQLLKIESAAAYYDRVMGLVRASRDKLPLAVHEIKYEAVVGDFDASVGGLLAFLGLAWDDGVREFAATAKGRTVGTPSATQVVRPLYSSAQGKWRRYRRFLEPQLPVLEPWVCDFGYAPS
jgi:tetratricopeptide (TPR) repeat protein